MHVFVYMCVCVCVSANPRINIMLQSTRRSTTTTTTTMPPTTPTMLANPIRTSRVHVFESLLGKLYSHAVCLRVCVYARLCLCMCESICADAIQATVSACAHLVSFRPHAETTLICLHRPTDPSCFATTAKRIHPARFKCACASVCVCERVYIPKPQPNIYEYIPHIVRNKVNSASEWEHYYTAHTHKHAHILLHDATKTFGLVVYV